ncbi:MAG: hypothetical protein K0S49_32 [Microbacterium sp.]|nr:hypothetical protein [Microbacterium sp.]
MKHLGTVATIHEDVRMDTQPPIDIVDRNPRAVVIEVDRDYCDRCDINVPAKVYAQLPSGRGVAYCGHHGNEYLPGLLEAGATVIDLRHADEP